MGAAGNQLGARDRIAAREQRYIVAEPDKLFSQV